MKPINFIDETANIGTNTDIWHFSVLLADVVVGNDCNIGSRVEIGRGCRIGNRVRISSGVFLPPNAVVEDDVFIGPNSVFTDDRRPRSGNKDYHAEPPLLRRGCSVGAGCVVLPSITIGRGAMVGAGSIVTKDVPDGAIVRGEPARVRSMVNFDIYADPMRTNLMETHLLPT